MKALLLFPLLLVSSAYAQQNWVALPDGFAWEDPAANQSKFTTSVVSTRLLSKTLRAAILAQWPDDKLPQRLTISEVDLNADKRHEVFVGIPNYSGTGGTAFMILRPTDEGFQSVGMIFGFGFEFLSPINGWSQIKAYSNGGGGNHTRILSQFRESEYEDIRIENHDVVNRTVRIRNPQAEQGGARQPATAVDSKSERSNKPKPVSEARPQ